MSSKNKKTKKIAKKLVKERKFFKISPEVKKSIISIILFCTALIFFLAPVKVAGPAGIFIYSSFYFLFGWGYYLLPLILLVVGIAILFSSKLPSNGLEGGTIFVISGLGLIDLLIKRGGEVGKWIAKIAIPFGKIPSLIIFSAGILISFLIIFNKPLKVKKEEEKSRETKKENDKFKQTKIKIEEINEPKTTITDIKNIPPKENTSNEKNDLEKNDFQNSKNEDKNLEINLEKFKKEYTAPPLSLLKSSKEKPSFGDLKASANIIKRTLLSFGIPVEMGEISIGPTVTRYTLRPAEGVKLSKITTLSSDLALALAASPIRIEAPIPGKSLVGIEVPNKATALVRLGTLLSFEEFAKSPSLNVPLGRAVNGSPFFADIEKMPHLLIAGATGSGKSICLHCILISLLYKNSPSLLKLILIDPKKVELSVYDGIPHLISPIIFEGKKVLKVLQWAVAEMEMRYEKLLNNGSRDIKSYNRKSQEPIPYLLIVIDELAELMLKYGREIESIIVRLAQMARATGIHLIVSTQRPSVEVITGLIKANITNRIALKVASQIDSRTILDSTGAEKLLGRGDMLYNAPELSAPTRIQGSYISEEEIQKVVSFIKSHNQRGEFLPDEEIENISVENNFTESEEDEELLSQAINVIKQAKKASASLLQRRLKIGYARAARILDILEERGIVGPNQGAKPREVYI